MEKKIICPKCKGERFMCVESSKVGLSLDEHGDLELNNEEYHDVEYQCLYCDYWMDSSDFVLVEKSKEDEECTLCGMVGLRTTLKYPSGSVKVCFNCPNLDCGNHKEDVN